MDLSLAIDVNVFRFLHGRLQISCLQQNKAQQVVLLEPRLWEQRWEGQNYGDLMVKMIWLVYFANYFPINLYNIITANICLLFMNHLKNGF